MNIIHVLSETLSKIPDFETPDVLDGIRHSNMTASLGYKRDNSYGSKPEDVG